MSHPVKNTPLFLLAAALLATAALPGAPLRASDWPHFLGPGLDLHSPETGLDFDFPETGPRKLWEVERGAGHAGPVVAGERVVFIHRVEEREEVRCLDAATGETLWEHSYPVEVGQNYGIVDAPRSSPVIDPEEGLVFTLGNDGDLLCLALEDGALVWQESLPGSFGPSPFFFGYGSSPLVHGGKLVVQVGAPGATVVAFDKRDGSVIWRTGHEWNGSYASPVVGEVNGEERIFVLAGGMVRPTHGGLLCIRPEDGAVDEAFPWRADRFTSVNASTPVPCGPNRVFITEGYGLGGVMLEFDAEFRARPLWTLPELGCQFQTPLFHRGTLYGYGGSGGLMMAVDANTGRVFWTEHFYLTTIPWEGRDIPMSLGHATIVHVDGSFLCLSENGALLRMELEPGGYRILAKTRLFHAPETWAAPVVSGGRLYVNQNALGSRLICYDVSGGGPRGESE